MPTKEEGPKSPGISESRWLKRTGLEASALTLCNPRSWGATCWFPSGHWCSPFSVKNFTEASVRQTNVGSRGYKDSSATKDHKTDCEIGKKKSYAFLHSYPWMSYSLLKRDLLAKIKAQIYFTGKGMMISPWPEVYTLCLRLKEYRLIYETLTLEASSLIAELQRSIPGVWAETNPPVMEQKRSPQL